MGRPLEGIKVVELATFVAAPVWSVPMAMTGDVPASAMFRHASATRKTPCLIFITQVKS